jgi:long-chain acyl-CoA synthetase
MSASPLILDRIYDHEVEHRDVVCLSQPIGGGRAIDITWGQMLHEARCMAAHLRARGVRSGDRVAMLAKNSAHFIIAEIAIWMAGGTTVAIFPTETAQTVRYVLEHSEASLLFIGRLDNWEQQRVGVPEGLPRIALPLAPHACAAANCESWEAIVARTAPLAGRPERAESDLAMLLYTSGSTGQPKGVMHTFGNLSRRSAAGLADPSLSLHDGPRRMLSYLPLAHVYERAVVECVLLYSGEGQVFFVDTLETFAEDLKRARPTIFVSVPRLWLKFQQGVLAHLPASTLDALLEDPRTAAPTARKVLASLSLDEVSLAVSGSAPIPAPLLQWYRRLGLNFIEGYAMTEDFAMSHRTSAEFCEPGYVGVPAPGVEARIDADGEVLIKTPSLMVGYYKLPELTAESFTEDGFFRTGDLGERRPDGQLRLIGRKKEMFKTTKGKYVAPAPIENRLNSHPMVELSMVSGVGKPAPYAMVMLNEQLRPRVADSAVRQQVESALAQLLRETNEELANHERLAKLVIAGETWSVDNGCLTPTLKIKRACIEALAAPTVDAWYDEPRPVVWARQDTPSRG